MSERCPTCGSDKRGEPWCVHGVIPHKGDCVLCTDSWHSGEASVSAPTTQPENPLGKVSYLLDKCKCGHAMAAHDFSSTNSKRRYCGECDCPYWNPVKVKSVEPEVSAPTTCPRCGHANKMNQYLPEVYCGFHQCGCRHIWHADNLFPNMTTGCLAAPAPTPKKHDYVIKESSFAYYWLCTNCYKTQSYPSPEDLTECPGVAASEVQPPDERAEFEKWAHLNLGRFPTLYNLTDPFRVGPEDEYMEDVIEFAWLAVRALSGPKEE